MMTTDIYSLWKDLIGRVATFTVRDFPDVEKEEVIQELYLFVVENSDRLKSPDQVGALKSLSRAAKEYAWSLRKQHLQLSSQYSYRTSDVRHILETVFIHDDWANVRIPDDAASEFNDVFLEINSDVKRAYDKLGHVQKKAIFSRYALGEVPTDPPDKQRLYRALTALTDNLNWYQKPMGSQYVGGRKVITNGNARYNIDGLTN